MRIKIIFTVSVMILSLSFGSTLMAQEGKTSRKGVRVHVTENRPGARLFFMDEDGDGICDHFQDHDGDGIPNGQDPDWEQPKDGTGEQNRRSLTHRNSFQEEGENSKNKRSFRYNWNQSGSPAGDGSGPNGGTQKRGGK